MGERQEAATQARECIKLDEEHKTCRALYRKYALVGLGLIDVRAMAKVE